MLNRLIEFRKAVTEIDKSSQSLPGTSQFIDPTVQARWRALHRCAVNIHRHRTPHVQQLRIFDGYCKCPDAEETGLEEEGQST